jgi:hypothetical protein
MKKMKMKARSNSRRNKILNRMKKILTLIKETPEIEIQIRNKIKINKKIKIILTKMITRTLIMQEKKLKND